jgi:hypothetical protein
MRAYVAYTACRVRSRLVSATPKRRPSGVSDAHVPTHVCPHAAAQGFEYQKGYEAASTDQRTRQQAHEAAHVCLSGGGACVSVRRRRMSGAATGLGRGACVTNGGACGVPAGCLRGACGVRAGCVRGACVTRVGRGRRSFWKTWQAVHVTWQAVHVTHACMPSRQVFLQAKHFLKHLGVTAAAVYGGPRAAPHQFKSNQGTQGTHAAPRDTRCKHGYSVSHSVPSSRVAYTRVCLRLSASLSPSRTRLQLPCFISYTLCFRSFILLHLVHAAVYGGPRPAPPRMRLARLVPTQPRAAPRRPAPPRAAPPWPDRCRRPRPPEP